MERILLKPTLVLHIYIMKLGMSFVGVPPLPPTQRHYFRNFRQFTNCYHFFVAIERRCKTN